MSQRDLTVLGCSSQVPTRHRNHNGYLLRWDGEGLLFDPGEGTQRQLIHAGIPPPAITRVFITHFHGDHCLGMAGMFQRLSLDGVPHVLRIYFPAGGEQYLERMRQASIYFNRLEVEYHPVHGDGVVIDEEAFRVEARGLDHPVPTFGYRLQEPDQRRFLPEALAARGLHGPVVARLRARGTIEHDGRTVHLDEVSEMRPGSSFAFVMDTRPCAGAHTLAHDADLLVCESTFLDTHEREAWERHHMTVTQAARLAREAGAHRLLLTHFSQRYPDTAPFREAAALVFPGAHVAEDLLQLPIPRRKGRGGRGPGGLRPPLLG